MCGICAISRRPDKSSIPDARSFMKHAVCAIESRGRHATGIGWATKDGWPWYWKEEGRATVVAGNAPLPTGIGTAIGHTRHATQGRTDDNRNNHPVTAPGIVLVHNGRIDNDDSVFKSLDGVHDRIGRVDSEAIAAMLAFPEHFDEKGRITSILEQIEGVASLAWLDTDAPHVLNLARCSQRPMTLGRTRRGDLVMSSTPATLELTARRTKVRIDLVEEVKQGTWLQVHMGDIINRKRFTPYEPPTLIAEDVPGGAPVKARSKARRHLRLVDEYGDGIDWSNLVPRRGWS